MTLLSRTADNLFWLGRYLERAENTARLLDVSYRMSQMPDTSLAPYAEWIAALEVVGEGKRFTKRFKTLTPEKVIAYLAVDDQNPSSISSALRAARENARAERNSIPTEVFESLNATWLGIKQADIKSIQAEGYRDFFDWVKERVHAVRGLIYGVMLQQQAFAFHRIGTFIERADNTARLVDVKFHVLSARKQDKIEDYYRWGALLRSLSAFKSYRTVYRDAVRPMQVVELLLLNPDFPRSLNHCTGVVSDLLETLGPETRGAFLAKRLHQKFSKDKIETVVRSKSLLAVLEDFTTQSAALSNQIAKDFLLEG
jgi:uncharacterized alpha-E superfamily protein